MEPLARALLRCRQALDAPLPADRAAHAVRAIDRYLAWAEGYAAGLARKGEREAARYVETGEPAAALPPELAQVKPDRTHVALRSYRAGLAHLRSVGVYAGPAELTRMRPDGSWEPLRLPGD